MVKKWIQAAIKKPGALRKELHVGAGKKIPAKKLKAAAKKRGEVGEKSQIGRNSTRIP